MILVRFLPDWVRVLLQTGEAVQERINLPTSPPTHPPTHTHTHTQAPITPSPLPPMSSPPTSRQVSGADGRLLWRAGLDRCFRGTPLTSQDGLLVQGGPLMKRKHVLMGPDPAYKFLLDGV